MRSATIRHAGTSPGHYLAVLLLAQTFIVSSHAAERSASHANAEFGATFGTVDSASNSNKSVQADFRLTIPVATLFGASLQGYFADTNIQIDMPTDLIGTTSCSYEALGGAGTLFARHPSRGRLGASISALRLDSKCADSGSFLIGNSDSLDSTGYSLSADYYFPALTVGAKRTVASYEGDAERVSDVLSASWYPLADLSISPNVGRIDGRTQHGVSIEYQPDFLGRSASVALSLASQRSGGDSIQMASLSFIYHFGLHVDLKTRDREFR